MPIVGVINQKGGVGKTTTAINLAAALARQRRVLLVDLDPQANATSGIGLQGVANSVYDVLVGRSSARGAVVPSRVPQLDVLPATAELAGAALELDASAEDLRLLGKALTGVRPNYDFILLDAPPSFGALTLNALVAADHLLLPVQCEYYALEGIAGMLDTIDRVRGSLHGELNVLGMLLTMADHRTNLSQQVEANVRQHFGRLVFDSVIPRTVRLAEAPSYGLSIYDYAPTSSAAVAYTALAEEVIDRVSQA
ncbi:MAG: ParA family protein [Trueperaceae bacterium]